MGDVDKIKYVPILKWRAGEKLALYNVYEGFKDNILPLIELVNDEGDHDDDLSKDIAAVWKRPAYLDVHYRRKDFAKTALDNIASHTNLGVDVIPVVWLDSPPIIIDSAKSVALMCHNGAAIRIDLYDDQAMDGIKNEIDLILYGLNLAYEKTDLILDFRYLDVASRYPELLKELNAALDMKKWRRVIISSSAFPATLTPFKVNADNFIPRSEWTLWQQNRNLIDRATIYSDYTVRNPENIDRAGQPSISVRYTLGSDYQIFRGKMNDEHFKYLAHGLNIVTLYDNEYPSSFSWGDNFIHEKAKELEDCLSVGYDPETANLKPGGFKMWIAASINHHLKVVLTENLHLH